MSKDDKIRLPSGQGGLTRFFDEFKSKIEIPPGAIIILTIVIIIIVILLQYFGSSFLK